MGAARADHLLVSLAAEFEDMTALQQQLFKLTGSRTVPQIFIGGKYVGGHDCTYQLRSCVLWLRLDPMYVLS